MLNAANEIAVHQFLENKVRFSDIPEIVRLAMDDHQPLNNPSLETLIATDQETRAKALLISEK